MAAKSPPPDKNDLDVNLRPPPIPADFSEALGRRYLTYALSTITARSLPDVRDGLKPVHRRLLFAMGELNLNPTGAFKKAAKVVGDVIGKFHPHGDQAVYETLVRLAQDFSLRYPLIDGQGNFGNIDGDNAAAMRYTEARLTEFGAMLMDGIDQGTVDLRPTYDNDGSEPVVMPAGFPNLLANGANGIAVGMATSIPPHNLSELCDGLAMLIAKPDCSTADLLTVIKGPDFPTGGVLIEPMESLLASYEKGRGGFRLRAKWSVENGKNGAWLVIISEIPYQLAKSRLIEKLAELLENKKLPLVDDVRDESADEVRLVIVPKSRQVDPAQMMEQLFRISDLEIKFPLNLNVLLADGRPQVIGLKAALQAWLDHRRQVLLRQSEHEAAAKRHRLELLAGFLLVFDQLDRIIAIIREHDHPKAEIMRVFALSDIQAQAILDMRLGQLRRLEQEKLLTEQAKLTKELAALEALLASVSKQWAAIDRDIKNLRQKWGIETPLGRRRTTIGEAPTVTALPEEAFAPREKITIILSEKGWIRAVGGHEYDFAEGKFKEGDASFAVVRCFTNDKLLIFASDGRCYSLAAERIPRGRGFGEPIRIFIDLPAEHEMLLLDVYDAAARYLLAAQNGRGFVVAAEQVLGQTRNGKQIFVCEDDVRVHFALRLSLSHLALIDNGSLMVILDSSDIPVMNKGRGVILQKLKPGVKLTRVIACDAATGLTLPVSKDGKTKEHKWDALTPYLAARGKAGRFIKVIFSS
ncbi:MAG: DNA topoisomerase IV subunit A [Candidatus Symbiobacter sp.]|nr:DNA topoisomerase IV subunit A [Candidatus Symbiobacter sp.]